MLYHDLLFGAAGHSARSSLHELSRNSFVEVDSHSITAVMIAAVRAYHYSGPEHRIFDDSLARALLSPAECEAFERNVVRWFKYLNPTLAASCSDRAAIV